MSETMQDIRRRMVTIESTQHITHAMRLVSAARFRRAKKQYDQISLQQEKIMGIMEKILARQSGMEPKAKGMRRMVILFTSRRGLCGAYNSSLIKAAAAASAPGDLFCAAGSRGADFFRQQEYEMLYSFEEGPEKLRLQDAEKIAGIVLAEWSRGNAAEVSLVSMHYVNALKQEPEVRRLLPLELTAEDGGGRISEDLEFHPSEEQVLSYLLPKYLQLMLWKGAGEAVVCEHMARRAAMETASENAEDMLKGLSKAFHRMRQQAITDELIEIVSGAESLK